MRGMLPTFVLLMSVLALPAVAADDPGLTLPDPDPLADSASDSADAQVESTKAYTRGVFFESSQAVNDVQKLTAPTSRISNTFNHTRDLGIATIENGHGLTTTAIDWSAATSVQKVDEVFAVLTAADEVGGSGVNATQTIAVAVLQTLCSAPLNASSCGDNSVVTAVENEVERWVARGTEEAQAERFGQTQAAALALVASVVPLP